MPVLSAPFPVGMTLSAPFSITSGTIVAGADFVVIAGLVIFVAEGQAVKRIERGGTSYRAYAGNLRSQIPWEKGGWQFTTGLLTNDESLTFEAVVAFGAHVACSGVAFDPTGGSVTCEITLGDSAYINTSTDDGTGVLRSYVVSARQV